MFDSHKINKEQFIYLQNQIKLENRKYKNILSDKNYKLVQIISNFFKAFTSLSSLKEFYKFLKYKICWNYLCIKYPIIKESFEKSNIQPNYFSDDKFIVYTSIFGNYDIPQDPLFVPDNCEFYIITDQNIPTNSIWKKTLVNYSSYPNFDSLSNIYKNRFCKMFPHKLFPNIKYSIYIDGNIKPMTDFTEFINMNSPHGLLFHKHKARKCVYDEIAACKILGKGNISKIEKYGKHLKNIMFPNNYGMLECNMIVREHSNLIMQKVMEEWWNEFLSSNTNRDQLSLPYVLWKLDIKLEEINKLGNNIAKNDALRIMEHIG